MAVRETVTIEVELEGDGLRKLATESKAVKKALTEVKKPAEDTRTEFQRNAELAEKMRRALGPLGDSLGDVTGGADDLANSLGGVSPKQAAVAAGALVLVSGMIKLGAAVYDVIANVENYAGQIDKLEGRGLISERDVQQLHEANAALTSLSAEATSFLILIAKRIAPALEDFARGSVAAIGLVTGGFAGARAALIDFERAQSEARIRIAEEAAASDEATTEAQRKQQEQRSQAVAQGAANREEIERKARVAQWAAEFDAHWQRIDAIHAEVAAESARYDTLRTMRENEINQRQIDTDDFGWNMARYQDIFEQYGEKRVEKAKENAQKIAEIERSTIQDTASAATDAIQTYAGVTSELLANIQALYLQTSNAQIGQMRRGSAEQRKALRQQFMVQKAWAISNAVIQGGLAFIQALAGSPPPASFILAGLTAAATAVQIGMIAAQKPTFHRGGLMAPDERMSASGRAVVRNNETEAVITSQGRQSFEDIVNQVNRGDSLSPAGGVTVMLDSAPIRGVVYAMARQDPSRGHRRRQ